MSVTALSGPVVVYGNPPSTGTENPNQYNPDNGPGIDFAMSGQMDTTVGYQPGQRAGATIYSWTSGQLYTVSYAPQTLNAAAIAAGAHAVSGTAMVLITTSANGVIVGQSLISRGNGTQITGLLALEGPVAVDTFGTNGGIAQYDIRTTFGRAVSVTGVSAGSGGAFVVRGYDYLGFPMSETITCAAGVNTVAGKKAFKYIFSVTPSFSDANNYSVGTTDVFGFPIRADAFEQLELYWGGAATGSATGTFAFADITNPATATTGDVRGTWLANSASNGSNVFALYQYVPPFNLPGSNGVVIGSGATSATTAVANKTLTFTATPSFVTVGMTLYDTTVPLAIPVGTTVTATNATTVTMSAGANIQVGSSDTIQFGSPSATVGLVGQPQFFSAATGFG